MRNKFADLRPGTGTVLVAASLPAKRRGPQPQVACFTFY
jgi:hypothetical protein